MLRTVADQPSLWEAILPEELRRLPAELARVDVLLDDPVFFAPFVPFFDPRIGRPSTPMETYLRLMFLKFRYRLGFESLCREVSDSIAWRQFCRIGIDQPVPQADRLDATARLPHPPGEAVGTETAPLPDLHHRRPTRPHRPTRPAPPRHPITVGGPHRRRHPPTPSPRRTQLTTRNPSLSRISRPRNVEPGAQRGDTRRTVTPPRHNQTRTASERLES